MPRTKSDNFSERERDALLIATASKSEIRRLCRQLGDDPRRVAERVRELLLSPMRSAPSTVESDQVTRSPLALANPGTLPLHRILLVDDDPARLAARLEEFRLHQFRLGFEIETATSGHDAVMKLQEEQFEAVLIELGSATEETRWMLEKLRDWSTPLAPILLNSEGMEVLDLRRLNRDAIRALATAFGKQAPPPYRKKSPARSPVRKPCQKILFDDTDEKKTGSS
jgi:CheY-like chemotaxis protein